MSLWRDMHVVCMSGSYGILHIDRLRVQRRMRPRYDPALICFNEELFNDTMRCTNMIWWSIWLIEPTRLSSFVFGWKFPLISRWSFRNHPVCVSSIRLLQYINLRVWYCFGQHTACIGDNIKNNVCYVFVVIKAFAFFYSLVMNNVFLFDCHERYLLSHRLLWNIFVF